MNNPLECPCGDPLYANCCEPFHLKKMEAPTAVALMRSRYSAYALGLGDYLYETHHPKKRGSQASMQRWADQVRFVQLEVLSQSLGEASDKIGKVAFRAHYVQEGQRQVMQELSRFKRYQGRWVYFDGTVD